MPAILDQVSLPVSALLISGMLALTALPTLAFSEEKVPGEAATLKGNEVVIGAATVSRYAAGKSANADSKEDMLISEVVPPEEGFVERATRASPIGHKTPS